MANRSFKPTQAVDQAVTHVFAKVDIGATGAATLSAADSVGVNKIVRDGAGRYTVTFGDSARDTTDKYNKLLSFHGAVIQTGNTATDLTFQVETDGASAGTVQFNTLAAAVETDPANGQALLLHFTLKNSSYSP